jgi:hypothetical protein
MDGCSRKTTVSYVLSCTHGKYRRRRMYSTVPCLFSSFLSYCTVLLWTNGLLHENAYNYYCSTYSYFICVHSIYSSVVRVVCLIYTAVADVTIRNVHSTQWVGAGRLLRCCVRCRHPSIHPSIHPPLWYYSNNQLHDIYGLALVSYRTVCTVRYGTSYSTVLTVLPS